MRRVNIGCGPYAQPGYINIDKNARWPNVDIVRDIRLGLPFDDSSVDEILASHVLEHLDSDELMNVMQECYRVLKPGCPINIVVPLHDLESMDHKLILSADSFDHLASDANVYYDKKFKWRITYKEVQKKPDQKYEHLNIWFAAEK